jgi:hypothetical protein
MSTKKRTADEIVNDMNEADREEDRILKSSINMRHADGSSTETQTEEKLKKLQKIRERKATLQKEYDDLNSSAS